MKIKLLVLFATIGLINAAFSASEPSDADLLQGKWQGTEKNATPDGPCYLTITGKNMEFHGVDTNEWYKGTFTPKEDAKPKQFIGTIKDCPAPDYNGKLLYAIYKIEKDVLTIAGNAPGEDNAPTAFDAAGARQFTFKRKSKD